MSKKLKLCPFCDGGAWLVTHGDIFGCEEGHRVECCGECGAMTDYYHDKQEAIEAWEQRA